MLELPVAVPVGARLIIGSGAMTAHGTVAWREGERCGVRFRTRIDRQLLDRMIARSNAVDIRRTIRVVVAAAAA